MVGEKEKFTREVAGKHKGIANSLKKQKQKHPKISKYKLFSYMKHKRKRQNVIRYLAFSSSSTIF